MDDFKKFVFKNIGFALILAVSALYIVKGLFTLDESGLSVFEIIGNSALSMAVGFSMNFIFRQSGILYAQDDREVIETNNLHEKIIDEITPYIDLLDGFCETENAEAKKSLRKKLLSQTSLRYDDCFDENGHAKEIKTSFIYTGKDKKEKRDALKKHRHDMKIYKKALYLKMTLLTPSSLTTDGINGNDPFDFGETATRYQAKKSGCDVVTRLLFGVLFGYYTFRKLDGASLDSILWNALQVAIYMIFGVIQMLGAYIFVKTDDRYRIVRKIDKLQKFRIYAERQKKPIEKSE